MSRLKGKVALITGSAQGQGEAEAVLFAREGASVVVTDMLTDLGEQVVERIHNDGGKAIFVHLNVTDSSEWQNVIERTEETFGGLNILVNNAAIWSPENIEDTTEELWDTMYAVNTKGPFLGTKAALPLLRKTGNASIINIASGSALKGAKGATAYASAKAALANFTRSTAIQFGPEGIRANCIHPGPVNTVMLRTGMKGEHERAANNLPVGRLGLPEDLAYGALYLASDEASYVTGAEICIDGGLIA